MATIILIYLSNGLDESQLNYLTSDSNCMRFIFQLNLIDRNWIGCYWEYRGGLDHIFVFEIENHLHCGKNAFSLFLIHTERNIFKFQNVTVTHSEPHRRIALQYKTFTVAQDQTSNDLHRTPSETKHNQLLKSRHRHTRVHTGPEIHRPTSHQKYSNSHTSQSKTAGSRFVCYTLYGICFYRHRVRRRPNGQDDCVIVIIDSLNAL